MGRRGREGGREGRREGRGGVCVSVKTGNREGECGVGFDKLYHMA